MENINWEKFANDPYPGWGNSRYTKKPLELIAINVLIPISKAEIANLLMHLIFLRTVLKK